MQKNLNIEKIAFKVVQMKFLAKHITNQKLSFDIFMLGTLYLLNIRMIFGIKKSTILTHTMLAIATNIPVLLMTGFVVQGHIYVICMYVYCM